MNLNAIKRKAARVFDATGINSLSHSVLRSAKFPFIRAVNYHDIPQRHAANFESHIRYYSENFANVDEPMLRSFLADGVWENEKPGLIISFDDGMRSHAEVAAPILEKYGFTGWFFVPSGWVAERIDLNPDVKNAVGEQQTLTLEQLRYLDQHHVVGCHTETHCRLKQELSTEKFDFEVLGAKASLEEMLGHPVQIFCWVGGEEYAYSREAAGMIKQGYELSFMTNNDVITPSTDPLQLQRTNIEAENPLSLVRFQLGGFLDAMYAPKRKRVNALTKF